MLNLFLISFVAGVAGTTIGAVISMFAKLKNDRVIALLMSFAAGFMLAVVFFDLFPESIKTGIPIWAVFLACIGGVLLIMGLNYMCEKPIEKLQIMQTENKSDSNFIRIGILMVLAIGLHNLPEGMAIGSMETVDKGFLLAILIFIHNIPEGIAMSAPLLRAGVGKGKTLLMSSASGVPTILGAFIGYWAGNISPMFISVCLAVAAGAMLYIVVEEMLRDSYRISNKKDVSLMSLVGILLGMVIINLL